MGIFEIGRRGEGSRDHVIPKSVQWSALPQVLIFLIEVARS